MHNMGWGYTCFVSAFAVFVSEKEIKVSKSPVLKAFEQITSIDQFNALNLPIIYTSESTDNTNVNKAFEIDLS